MHTLKRLLFFNLQFSDNFVIFYLLQMLVILDLNLGWKGQFEITTLEKFYGFLKAVEIVL